MRQPAVQRSLLLALLGGGVLLSATQLRPSLQLSLTGARKAQLSLSAETGFVYRVESSGNLTNWATLTNFLHTADGVVFTDDAATNLALRFYRAVRTPAAFSSAFNGPPVFTLFQESAANPSSGNFGSAIYNRGIHLAGTGSPAPAPDLPGLAQDTGDGLVMLHSGELVLHAMDLEVRSRGFNWRFERRYRSGVNFDGPLGRNWDFTHNRRLQVEPNGDVTRMDGTGRADRFTASGGAFNSPRGVYSRLVRNPDSTFTERDRHGNKVLYSLTNAQGIARITQASDRQGNRMNFTYNGAGQLTQSTDTLGRPFTYSYDGAGRLTQVQDFTARTVQFSYDANGDLVAATSPAVTGTPNGNDFPSGKTTRYRYSSGFADEWLNHNLLEVTAPNEAAGGPPFLRAAYQTSYVSPDTDRLTQLVIGGTNASGFVAGGTNRFSYAALGAAPANDFIAAVTQTTVTDRNGNLAEHQFNQLGQIVRVREFSNRDLRAGDPDFFETRLEYNGDGELTKQLWPEGNFVAHLYDSANADRFQQGNVLRSTRTPDAARGAVQSSLVTTFNYEPMFNQVRTSTGPRGNDAGYVPQNGGVTSAARYTTTLTYDYQEAASAPPDAAVFGIVVPGALLNRGDVNGDGIVTQARGNVVLREDPAVTLLAGSNQALAEGTTAQAIKTRTAYNDFGLPTQVEDPRGNISTSRYFPDNDPDGDGQDLTAGLSGLAGGYLSTTVRDAFAGPNRRDTNAPPAAITNRFTLDRRGNVVVLTDARGFTWRSVFNALDQVVQTETPKLDVGQATGFLRNQFYDANNNLTGVDIQNVTTSPTTHLPVISPSRPFFQHRFAYDILKQLVEETRDATRDPAIPPSSQPEMLISRRQYDANGNLVRTSSPLAVSGADANNTVATAYDERDLSISTTRGGASPGASTVSFAFDRNRNGVRTTDTENNDAIPGNEFETFVYDGYDRRRQVVDRAGGVMNVTLDPDGRPTYEEFNGPAVIGGQPARLSATDHLYDELGRRIQVNRHLFIAGGIALTNVVPLLDGSLTPGDGKVSERNEYDANGRRAFHVTDESDVNRYIYDGAGRFLSHVTPLVDNVTPGGPFPTRTDYTYDALGNVVRTVETHTSAAGLLPPAALTNLHVYDALNRLVRVTSPEGHTSQSEYDSRGLVVSSYDARGPLIADPLGLFAGQINDRGNAMRFSYDGLGRRWKEVRELTATAEGGAPLQTDNPYNPDGLITLATTWDANSRVATRADDLTNTTSWTFDPLNRPTGQVNADGGTRSWTYDRDGHITTLRDENNTLHTFNHDALDRLVSHALAPDATKTNIAGLPLLVGTTLQTFAYDGLSRLIRSTDNNAPADATDDWAVTSVYDSLGRLVEEVQNGRAVSSGYVSHDRSRVYYPGNNRVVDFAYDPLHHLVGVTNHTALNLSFSWFGNCPPLRENLTIPGLASVIRRDFTYDRNLRPTNITEKCFGFDSGTHSLVRNRAGDVTLSYDNTVGAVFEYRFRATDSAGREKYSYYNFTDSQGGSGTSEQSQLFNGAQALRETRDGANTPLQFVDHDPMHQPLAAFMRYDASPGAGVRTRDANFIYQWDGLNRLRVARQRTNTANIVATYTYDAQPAIHGGRRVQKVVGNSGALNGTTRFYYDGFHCIEETTVSGQTERVARQFVFGAGADEVHAMDADTNGDGVPDKLWFYLRDHNNNTQQLFDTNGQRGELYTYDLRGKPTLKDPVTLVARSNSVPGNPWLFTGQRYDAETGLYYYKARYYDPGYGVFLSRDPLGVWGDPASHGNPMALVGNNFWNRRDPSGLNSHEFAAVDKALERSRVFGAGRHLEGTGETVCKGYIVAGDVAAGQIGWWASAWKALTEVFVGAKKAPEAAREEAASAALGAALNAAGVPGKLADAVADAAVSVVTLPNTK